MYDLDLMNTLQFREDRLIALMEKRGLTPGKLEYMTGISQPMISLLMNGKRPNVSAVNVAKLADALGCSIEYLLGMSEDPDPRALSLSDALQQLIAVARTLPSFRQRDLVQIAEMYQSQNETEDTRLMSILLEKINEVGTEEAENLLLDAFESLRSSSSGLTPSDSLLPLQQSSKPADSHH